VYAAVAGVAAGFHEPWRDEAQAWLLARDLDLFSLLRQVLVEEGTPPLWHLILFPLPRLGLPYGSMQAVHVALSVTAVGLFTATSPFSRWQKASFAFSYLMLFEYAVLARSYVLSVVLVFALAGLRGRRRERRWLHRGLLVGLGLSNVDGLVLAVAIGCYCWWVDRREPDTRHGRVPLLAGGAFIALGFAGAAWYGHSRFPAVDWFGIQFATQALLAGLANWQPRAVAVALVAALFAVLTIDLWRRPAALALLYAPVAFLVVGPLARFARYPRHGGFVLLIVLYVVWTQLAPADDHPARRGPVLRWPGPLGPRTAGSLAGVLLFASLAASVPSGVRAVLRDIRGAYSGSAAMAEYLRRELPDAPIAAWRAPNASALLPYLPGRKFWYVNGEEWGTFITWSRREYFPRKEVLPRLYRRFHGNLPWLLLTRRLRYLEGYGYTLRHQEIGVEPEFARDERYFLYEPHESKAGG
jgi:hypothetical protein